MELKGKKVNFLGDSITEGVGVTSFSDIYHQVMKRKYGLAEARAYGVSGTRFARQIVPSENAKYDRDFCTRLFEMDDDADIVVVFGGTNDFGHGDAPIGMPCDREPDTFYGACHYLYSNLIKKYPTSVIVIATPCHRRNEDNVDGDCHQKKYGYGNLKLYVDIIREVAECYGLPVVDLYATLGLQPNIPVIAENFMPDGLHPNAAGNMRIAERIGGFLLSL